MTTLIIYEEDSIKSWGDEEFWDRLEPAAEVLKYKFGRSKPQVFGRIILAEEGAIVEPAPPGYTIVEYKFNAPRPLIVDMP